MACNLSILFEGSEGIEVNGAHLTLAGGTLYGCVSVSRCRPENGTEIDGEATSYLLEVTFEGELLNVISLLPPAAILERQRQLKFLRVTYTARLSGSEIVQNSDSRNVLIPFHFVIPSSIYGVDKNVYLGNGEEPLPPSLSLFSDTIQSQEKESLLVRGECKITYGVRARLFTNTGRYAGEAFRPVHFIPTRDLPLPPLYARDFVSEYVPSASQRIGLCHWIQSSSELAILTEEPLPLQFGWDRTVFTTLCLRLRYHNPSSPGTSSRVSSAPPPPDISLVVQTTLEAVTFFSVSPQGILPELKNAEPGLEVVKEKVLCLTQTRKLRISTWFPLAERDSKDDLGYNNVNQRHRYKGPVAWQSTASLVFTYEGNECPIPTFACTYASRRHFLSLRIQLDGHCSARYRLRVPVQIIYNSGCLPDAPESTRLYEEPIADWALPPVYTA